MSPHPVTRNRENQTQNQTQNRTQNRNWTRNRTQNWTRNRTWNWTRNTQKWKTQYKGKCKTINVKKRDLTHHYNQHIFRACSNGLLYAQRQFIDKIKYFFPYLSFDKNRPNPYLNLEKQNFKLILRFFTYLIQYIIYFYI